MTSGTRYVEALLEANSQEQARLLSEIAAMQERLEWLQEHRRDIEELRAKGETPAASAQKTVVSPTVEGEASDARQAVPEQRPAPAKKAASKRGKGAKRGSRAARPATKKPEPVLPDVVRQLLTDKPQTVRDLTTAMTKGGRQSTPELVRNAVETLVSRSLAHRYKQGRTVLYTAVASDTSETSTATPDAGVEEQQVEEE